MLYSRENYSSNLHFRPKSPRIKTNFGVLIVFHKVDEKKLRSVEVRLHRLETSVPKLMKGLAILIPNLGWLRFRKVLRIKKRLI